MTAPTPSITQTRFGGPLAPSVEPHRDHTAGSSSRRSGSPPRAAAGAPTLDDGHDGELAWLLDRGDSDEDGPLRLTLTRASSGSSPDSAGAGPGTRSESGAGWQPIAEQVRLASGRRVPGTRYRIVRWLGEGGMGMVFEALHVDIQRPVALKILKLGVAGSELQRERFLDEARAVAAVDSRFVVDVLDFGELPDGRPFYTMELLDPVSLAHQLRDGPMPLARAVPLLRQCCKALAAVHERELAHRDVKPQNVLLQREDGRDDAVRIVDFGIAAKFSSQPRIAGTAMYMAPEQIRGVAFDGRLDVYGLGCVAFELLTGAPPFDGASAAEVVQRHLHDDPPSARARVPSLPPAVDALLRRCLAKDPDARPADMHAVEAALCEIQIVAGFTTAWDDLPLPALPEAERSALRRRMPQPRAAHPRLAPRVRLIAAALVVGLASAGAVLARTEGPVDPSTEFDAEVAAIHDRAEAARVAASRAYWAYPPASDPEYPTALRMITALEREPGSLRHLAQLRATQLRREFAETLVRLGDQYWSAPHGRPFAVEFYAQALLFDPDAPRARARASLTPAQLADVASRAHTSELSSLELELGEALRALAEDDPSRRGDRVAELLASNSSLARSIRFRAQLGAVAGLDPREPEPASPSDAAPGLSPDASPPAPARPPAPNKPDEADSSATTRGTLTKAESALRRGQRDKAERLFSKLLAQPAKLSTSELARAHAGLAEIQFARGRYHEAMSAARRATQARPRDANLQLLLGDACLKTLRYADARAAYEKARSLGHAKAAQRLAQLDEVSR